MTPEQINNLFTTDKSDWFIETENGIRIWDSTRLDRFWEIFQNEKIKKADYNFENFVFPTFSKSEQQKLNLTNNYYVDTFTLNGNLIERPVIFKNCRFQGYTLFLGNITEIQNAPHLDVIYGNKLNFINCKFEQEFRLQAVKIVDNLSITNCEFFEEFNIMMSQIAGQTHVNNTTFQKRFLYHGNQNVGTVNFSSLIFNANSQFGQNHFQNHFSINTAEFNDKLTLHSNNYHKNATFVNFQINHKSSFKNEHYDKCSFQDIDFSQKSHSFEEILLTDDKTMVFRNTIFNNRVSFRNCDCDNIIFYNSDITDIKFTSCNWNSSKRLLMKNESKDKNGKNNNLKTLENLYRQLKRNFEHSKNWELSGKAYISEMTIRKKRLWQDKNYLSWFIYSFYDIFGGFTQNYIKPLVWLLVLTVFLFPLYYLFGECLLFDSQFNLIRNCNIGDVFKKSFASSIPFIKTDLVYANWWVQSFQTIISTILLTFLILALRKRFKQ